MAVGAGPETAQVAAVVRLAAADGAAIGEVVDDIPIGFRALKPLVDLLRSFYRQFAARTKSRA